MSNLAFCIDSTDDATKPTYAVCHTRDPCIRCALSLQIAELVVNVTMIEWFIETSVIITPLIITIGEPCNCRCFAFTVRSKPAVLVNSKQSD